jgi:hypothetical protein
MQNYTFYRRVDAILDEKEDDELSFSDNEGGSEDHAEYVVEAIVDDRVNSSVILSIDYLYQSDSNTIFK